MRAVFIQKYGNNEVVEYGEMPQPSIMEPTDVLVQIHAASLNPVDFKIRDGKLKAITPYKFPLIIGNDLSGVVVDIGKNVTRFAKGDKVFARIGKKNSTGTCAEYACVAEENLAKKPDNITFEEAASIPLVALTSWQALNDRGNLQKGDRVFIHAGSGGIGSVAIPIAKNMGLWVGTTTGTKNIDFVKQLGADEIVDYKTQDFTKEVKDYDMVLDTIGGTTLNRSFDIVKEKGKVITISALPDQKTLKEFNVKPFIRLILKVLTRKVEKLARSKNINYSFLFMKPDGKQLEHIAGLLKEGKLKAIIDSVYPLEKTKDALAYLEKGHAKGKVVIQVIGT